MKGLALRLWSNPGTVLCKKVGSLCEKGEELKESSLPVLRRLLGREAIGSTDGLHTGGPRTPTRTSYRHRLCGALWPHPGWSLQPT